MPPSSRRVLVGTSSRTTRRPRRSRCAARCRAPHRRGSPARDRSCAEPSPVRWSSHRGDGFARGYPVARVPRRRWLPARDRDCDRDGTRFREPWSSLPPASSFIAAPASALIDSRARRHRPGGSRGRRPLRTIYAAFGDRRIKVESVSKFGADAVACRGRSEVEEPGGVRQSETESESRLFDSGGASPTCRECGRADPCFVRTEGDVRRDEPVNPAPKTPITVAGSATFTGGRSPRTSANSAPAPARARTGSSRSEFQGRCVELRRHDRTPVLARPARYLGSEHKFRAGPLDDVEPQRDPHAERDHGVERIGSYCRASAAPAPRTPGRDGCASRSAAKAAPPYEKRAARCSSR